MKIYFWKFQEEIIQNLRFISYDLTIHHCRTNFCLNEMGKSTSVINKFKKISKKNSFKIFYHFFFFFPEKAA